MEVLCIGQIVADIIARPLTSFTFQKDTTAVDSIELTNGGDAFNTSVDLAKLGVETSLAGKIGNDMLGKLLLNRARELGIDMEGVRVSAQDSTSACIVLVHKEGERVFIYHGGANDSLVCEDIDQHIVDQARIIHFGGVLDIPGIEGACMTEMLQRARAGGKTTSMDVTWDNEGVWLKKIETALPFLDYFLPSINETKHLIHESDPPAAAEKFLAMGVKNVVIKLGPSGCYIANKNEKDHIKAYSVPYVVDTTGAGDAFVAGFLAGVARKWSFRDCAKLGNAVGALAVQEVGATEGVTCFEDAAALVRGCS